MDIIEHNGVAPLIALIDGISRGDKGQWIVACVRRDFLKPITNEAFLMAITPCMQKAGRAHVFFSGSKKIYIAWCGELKAIYKQLRGAVIPIASQAGSTEVIISYADPHANGENFKTGLKQESRMLGNDAPDNRGEKAVNDGSSSDPLGWNDEKDNPDSDGGSSASLFAATPEQINHFNAVREQKRYRKYMQILVVEDHAFFQKLLCEIIRGTKITGVEPPVADVAEGLKTAWSLFLKKAHDIVFVDLGLADGSGHALTRAIKEIDPAASVNAPQAGAQELHLTPRPLELMRMGVSSRHNRGTFGDTGITLP